jgi:ubiquinol-cytochrome c reductase cytochrome c1 subunit
MRYNRIARDLRLPEEVMKQNLMFNTDKLVDTMQVAMNPEDAKRWFGTSPPDLSLIGRSRGPRWLNAYLQGFYLDPSRPTGANNRYFKDVAMPHVLWELQGWQEAEFQVEKAKDGHEVKHLKELKLVTPGQLNPEQYGEAVRDLVNFLVYIAEPARQIRERLGPWILIFLSVLTGLFWLLKLEYWKDVH